MSKKNEKINMGLRIRVEVRNEILGDSVFWEGDAQDIHEIRNVAARQTAMLVANDRMPRKCGMWYVFAISEPESDGE